MVILEVCRHELPELRHLVYASSSSVYGGNTQAPVLGRGPGRPADLALRRDQAGGRAAEPLLQPPLPPAGDRPALLHGLRPLGPARHGGLPVRRRDHRRPADHALQPAARCSATSPTSTTSSPACWPRSTGRRAAARRKRRTSSTISATIARSSSATSSRCSRRRSAARAEIRARPAAARRRRPHLRRHRGQPARPRLRAQDPDRGGPAALRRLVSRLSRALRRPQSARSPRCRVMGSKSRSLCSRAQWLATHQVPIRSCG